MTPEEKEIEELRMYVLIGLAVIVGALYGLLASVN